MFDALKRKKHANRNRIGFICRILVLFCTALYCTVSHCTILFCTVLYCTALYCTVLYCTILYCTYTVRAHSSYLQIPRESESRADQIKSNQIKSNQINFYQSSDAFKSCQFTPYCISYFIQYSTFSKVLILYFTTQQFSNIFYSISTIQECCVILHCLYCIALY